MSCDDLAIALTEAALEGAEEPALSTHVESCGACRADLEALRRTVGRVKGARGPLPGPPPLRGRGRAPGRGLLVAAFVAALVVSLAVPLLLAQRAADHGAEPASLEPPSPADPRLIEPDAPRLLATASWDELSLVELESARALVSENTPDTDGPDASVAMVALGARDTNDLLMARLDGPAVERALERLGR